MSRPTIGNRAGPRAARNSCKFRNECRYTQCLVRCPLSDTTRRQSDPCESVETLQTTWVSITAYFAFSESLALLLCSPLSVSLLSLTAMLRSTGMILRQFCREGKLMNDMENDRHLRRLQLCRIHRQQKKAEVQRRSLFCPLFLILLLVRREGGGGKGVKRTQPQTRVFFVSPSTLECIKSDGQRRTERGNSNMMRKDPVLLNRTIVRLLGWWNPKAKYVDPE